MNEKQKNKCSKCDIFTELCPSNISRKTGERLFRSWCISCEKSRKDLWRSQNKEKHNIKTKEWVKNNPEKRKEISVRYRQQKLKDNPDWERELHREYRKTQPEYYRAMVAVRRKRVQQATTKWTNLKELRQFYMNCPEGYHVDHIIPLKGKNVCGLHVINNLQYLPAEINLQKRNHFQET